MVHFVCIPKTRVDFGKMIKSMDPISAEIIENEEQRNLQDIVLPSRAVCSRIVQFTIATDLKQKNMTTICVD